MENHFGENLPVLPKVQKFPAIVGCFHEIATNCLKTLAQLANGIHVRYFFLTETIRRVTFMESFLESFQSVPYVHVVNRLRMCS